MTDRRIILIVAAILLYILLCCCCYGAVPSSTVLVLQNWQACNSSVGDYIQDPNGAVYTPLVPKRPTIDFKDYVASIRTDKAVIWGRNETIRKMNEDALRATRFKQLQEVAVDWLKP